MPAETTTTPPETEEAPKWGALDTVGLIAGVILVAIVIDIASDGRLISRRLRPRPPQPAPEAEVPVE